MKNHRVVAIVDPLGSHGGLHYYVDSQARALCEQGFRTIVFTPPVDGIGQAPYVAVDSFVGVYGPASKLHRGLLLSFGLLRAAFHARRSGVSTCLFHIFKADVFDLWGVLACRMFAMRPVCIVHDIERIDRDRPSRMLRAIVAMSTRLVVHNAFSRDALLGAVGNIPAKVSVVPHGNYVSQFPDPPGKDAARRRLGLPSDRLILLFFGNPRPTKGLHILLSAMQHYSMRRDLLLLIAGKMKSDTEDEHRTVIARSDMTDLVRMDVGHVADEDVAYYYRAADLAILPYLAVYESGVALMSMSLGCPVLASNLEPFVELTDGGTHGLLFESGNVADLAEHLGRILADPSSLGHLGESAARFVRTHRSWRRSGELLAEAISLR